jgi:NADPH:quinone reductase-like Zn-dependent oxidoreductase
VECDQRRRPVRPGETVLILGSGGVALMAILLAKAAGARTIVTTSGPERAEQLRALGRRTRHRPLRHARLGGGGARG